MEGIHSKGFREKDKNCSPERGSSESLMECGEEIGGTFRETYNGFAGGIQAISGRPDGVGKSKIEGIWKKSKGGFRGGLWENGKMEKGND